MKKFKIGDWVWLKSPLPGDINKRKGHGPEIRLGFIEKYLPKSDKYKIQMLTRQDNENTNWVYYRKNGQVIEARDHYYVKTGKWNILYLDNSFNYEKLSTKELEEISIIRIAKRKELEIQRKKVIEELQRNNYER